MLLLLLEDARQLGFLHVENLFPLGNLALVRLEHPLLLGNILLQLVDRAFAAVESPFLLFELLANSVQFLLDLLAALDQVFLGGELRRLADPFAILVRLGEDFVPRLIRGSAENAVDEQSNEHTAAQRDEHNQQPQGG